MHSRLLTSLLLLSFSSSTLADLDEIYHLSIGASIETYNSELSVNTDSNENKYNLEDTLGLDNEINAGWISAWYRVGESHRLKLTYIPIERSSSIKNSTDITFEDTTIKAGATVASNIRTEIFDFSYIYSLYKKPQMEVGLSAGIYWLSSSTRIIANGEILAEGDDQPSLKSDYFSEQKIQAPMPLLGLSINYEFSPAWRTSASIRYLSLQLGEVDGRILSAELAGEYYFNNNWGAGISISTFDLNINSQNVFTNTALGWAHDGIQIYAIFKY